MKDGRISFALVGQGRSIDYVNLLGLLHSGAFHCDVPCEVSGQLWSQEGYAPRTGRQNLLRQYGRSFQESGCAKRLEYIGEEVGGAFIDRELAAPFPNFRDS